MNTKQSVKEFIAPLMCKLLDNRYQYALKKCQIIRAKANIECMEKLHEKPEKILKKHKLIQRYEKHLTKMEESTYWTNIILGSIADILVQHYNGAGYQICGPFGLSSETSIWVYPTEEDQKNSNHQNLLCALTFVPCILYSTYEEGHNLKEIVLYVKDYSKKNNDFPENSIGALNGGNYKNIDISNWPLKKLIDHATNKLADDTCF